MMHENEAYLKREIEWLNANDLDTDFLIKPIIEPKILLSD
jgi:hypothetical protein